MTTSIQSTHQSFSASNHLPILKVCSRSQTPCCSTLCLVLTYCACAGAFPEIQVAQYPLDMGKSDQKKSTKTLATTVGADGNINFDAIVKQGRNKDKYIASDHNAMVPKLDKLKDTVRLLYEQSSGNIPT